MPSKQIVKEVPLSVKALSVDGASGVNMKEETVTPSQAAAWLHRNGKNRVLNTKRVETLAAAMRRGEWRVTAEAIKLDEHGNIRDGQHRLHAIVRSGVSIRTWVARGVSEDAFDVMDSGRSRSVTDVLGIHDFGMKHATGAAVRLLMCYERYNTFEPNIYEAQAIVSPVTVLKYLQEHPDVSAGVRLGDRVKHAGLIGGVGTWGALFTLFSRKSTEDAHLFAHHLSTGEDMGSGHPALLLRNRLSKSVSKPVQSHDDREQMAAVVIKAWNAFRLGKSLSTLYWRSTGLKPEPFPKVN